MRIIVTAGGTMGHINPALAIIEEFKKHEKDLDILYIGTHNRMEKDIIPAMNINYIPLTIYGFTKNVFYDFKNIFCLYFAFKKCEKIIDDFKPDVVIGVGGYVTYPVLKVAHEKNVLTFIHEQNSIPGKSNKMIAKYADYIGLTFETSKKYFSSNGKFILTGNPCSKYAKSIKAKNKKNLGMSPSKRLITFVAGSLGSDSLNQKMKEFLMMVGDKDYEVCYITGKMHYDSFIKGKVFPKNVHVYAFMDELPGLLKISDIVVSRAGSGSLSEIMALEVPSIIIPSPNVANNHQYYNAKELSDKGCVILLEEKSLSALKLEEEIDSLLNDSQKKAHMKYMMSKEGVINSSQLIYETIKEALQNK